MTRIVADANTSRHFVKACARVQPDFPIIHVADWTAGKHLRSKDPVLLLALREQKLVLASFDRRSMTMHAADLTRAGAGHAGIILFRRVVSQLDYGKQSRLLVNFWRDAARWDWADRIVYLPL